MLLEAVRPRQWTKNLLVVAAPAAATQLGDPEVAARTLVAFVVFTMAAGSTYLGNDTADAAIDRLHPTRRHRPVASGRLDPVTAQVVAALLAGSALAVAWITAPGFGAVIAVYLAVNIAYSLGMKRVPVIELAAVASGFALRAVGGGSATGVPLSTAFVVVVSAVSVFIVSAKRGAELRRTNGIDGRAVLRPLQRDRARPSASGGLRWSPSSPTQPGCSPPRRSTTRLRPCWRVCRCSHSQHRSPHTSVRSIGGIGEDPEEILRRDRRLQVLAVAWLASYGAAINV